VVVIAASGITGVGLDEIRAQLGPGVTGALVGSSGVGKSTLVNAIVGQTLHATHEVRASDERGMHTTTFRALVPLAGADGAPGGGGMLVDSPGMRELGVWDADEGVRAAFGDVEAVLGDCRFSDCKHQGEPGCGVQAAIDAGTISAERYQAYVALLAEQDAQAEVIEPLDREAKKKRIKLLSRVAKDRAAEKRRGR
jgi:ribosome biogenesis GTPase